MCPLPPSLSPLIVSSSTDLSQRPLDDWDRTPFVLTLSSFRQWAYFDRDSLESNPMGFFIASSFDPSKNQSRMLMGLGLRPTLSFAIIGSNTKVSEK